jgi:hypothetical protein
MPGVYSILGFVAHLKVLDLEMKTVGHAVVAKACQMVANAAKEALGTYEFGWIPLKPETIAHKMRGDSPLLETGELRDSEGNIGHVGSNADRAVWMELGTSKIPPRSFLAAAAMQQEHLIHKMAERAVIAIVLGKGLASSEMRELMHFLHALKHAGHVAGEALDTIVSGPDDEKNRR